VLHVVTAQGGVRLYHESLRRFIVSQFDEGAQEAAARILPSVAAWLKKAGFFANSRACRFLLPLLARMAGMADLATWIGPDFVERSVARMWPPARRPTFLSPRCSRYTAARVPRAAWRAEAARRGGRDRSMSIHSAADGTVAAEGGRDGGGGARALMRARPGERLPRGSSHNLMKGRHTAIHPDKSESSAAL
jgi:uncharacterized membrane protein YgcG